EGGIPSVATWVTATFTHSSSGATGTSMVSDLVVAGVAVSGLSVLLSAAPDDCAASGSTIGIRGALSGGVGRCMEAAASAAGSFPDRPSGRGRGSGMRLPPFVPVVDPVIAGALASRAAFEDGSCGERGTAPGGGAIKSGLGPLVGGAVTAVTLTISPAWALTITRTRPRWAELATTR